MPGRLGRRLEPLLLCPQAVLTARISASQVDSLASKSWPLDWPGSEISELLFWCSSMADLLLAAAPPAPAADAAADADLDALLDAVTAIKAQQKQLEQQLEPLLEALSEAMAAGQLDPSFSHHDWAFSHSPGRLSYFFFSSRRRHTRS